MGKSVDFLIIGFTGPIGCGCSTLAKNISKLTPNGLIKRKGLYEKVCSDIKNISISMKTELKNNRINELNNNLYKSYEMRGYLSEIQKFNDPNFTYISMSSLIAKIALKYLDTSEFDDWEKRNSELGKVFRDFKAKWNDAINLFDRTDDKSFNKISEEDLHKIDEMLNALNLLKDDIKKKELKMYFNEEVDEFYLQSFGDNLRRSGNPFNFNEGNANTNIVENVISIPREVNRLIKFHHNRNDSKKSCCFIIDAFRNSIEVEYFKKRYAQFYLVSLYASRAVRFNRLRKLFNDLDNDIFTKLFNKLDDRDLGEDEDINTPFKQNVSRCCYLSDIAINNEDDIMEFDDVLFQKFLKYYALMISPGCIQPTKEETYMNLAYTLSLRSTCISRKVGAVITDVEGFLLGVGWNDVAHSQIGCGLRFKEDLTKYNEDRYSMNLISDIIQPEDITDINDTDAFCFKDVLSKIKIRDKLKKSDLSETKQKELLNLLRIKRLEYCRSLHAEENALLQVAAKGGRGVTNGTIYTTTFPCELCAKKIYQSGLKRIYYTEPYPNSISENVFLQDGIRKIEILQFEGVKSFSYFKLFKPHLDRKEAQCLNESYDNLF